MSKAYTKSWKVHLFGALLLALSGVQVFVFATLVAGGNGEQGCGVLVME